MTDKNVKSGKKPFAVKPSIYAACVELAKGSATAGGLLCQIAVRSEGDTLMDEKGVKGWLVLSSTQWRCITGFTRHQHNDALNLLKKMELIEHRRRKLNYKDAAALVWIRLADKAKTGIAEIMNRKPISAFGEVMPSSISAKPDNAASPISDLADELIEMNILQNEDIFENVVISETTTSESHFSLEESSKKSKSKKEKSDKPYYKKEWFDGWMKEIYKDSSYSLEPYKESSANTLLEVREYLESNPGGFFEFCADDAQNCVSSLKTVIENWEQFSWLATEAFGGFNIPPMPQLWSIKHQLKVIPDFIKFKKFAAGLTSCYAKEGMTLDNKSEHLKNTDHFFKYLETPAHQREAFLASIVKKKVTSASNIKTAKLQMMLEQEKKAKASGGAG